MAVSVLITAGFRVSERFSMRPRSFDLIAARKEELLVIKVVSHIDSVSEDIARDLDNIARYLKGSPLIIGERARDTELERGVMIRPLRDLCRPCSPRFTMPSWRGSPPWSMPRLEVFT